MIIIREKEGLSISEWESLRGTWNGIRKGLEEGSKDGK